MSFQRIVKMTFRPEEVDRFLAVFDAAAPRIRAFPGCEHLELWRDRQAGNILFTYSLWAAEDDLEAYRHSDLFRATWAKTKPLFAERAAAWSLDRVRRVE